MVDRLMHRHCSLLPAGFPGHRGVGGGGVGSARHREEAARCAHQPAEPLGRCHADDTLQLRDRAVAGAVRTTLAMGGMTFALRWCCSSLPPKWPYSVYRWHAGFHTALFDHAVFLLPFGTAKTPLSILALLNKIGVCHAGECAGSAAARRRSDIAK